MRMMNAGWRVVTVGVWLVVGGCRTVREAPELARESFGKAEGHYLFFADATPRCRLVLPGKPEPEESEAAGLIRDIFRDMGGGEVGIVKEPAADFSGVDIHVGATDWVRSLALLPADLDQDGFVIHPGGSRRLALLGGRAVGTLYAATEFLERYAGILWVWPGENGTVIPQTKRLEATVRHQVSAPAFLAREFTDSGVDKAKLACYRIHSALRGRDIRSSFHHAVHRLLTPELYATHPEYFSMHNGKRKEPVGGYAWQACTSNPDVIRLFVEAAKRQFRERPWVRSFSVSQNDGDGFCECDACRALDVPGVRGVSDRYFTFVNAVADGIRDEYPDKLIACFAYNAEGTASVPVRVKLRSNTLIYLVIPTLADLRESVIEWSKAAPNLGAYFWIHGKAAPKFYPHRWAEYLRFLSRHHVKEVFAEAGEDGRSVLPSWPPWLLKGASWELDGPRYWITAKLLWNPNADVDELMERFCRGFYGAGAAPMVRYYRRCEQAWERRPDPFDFGREYWKLDLGIYNAADVDVMEDCIRKARALTEGDAAASARLKALATALTPVAAHARLTDNLNPQTIRGRADAEAFVAKVHAYEETARELARDGRMPFTLSADTETTIDECCGGITRLLGNQADAFWRNVKETKPELERFTTAQLLAIAGGIENVATNSSLEVLAVSTNEADAKLQWLALDAPGWAQWNFDTNGTVGIAVGVARTGGKSLVIEGVHMACGIYTHPVKPGERFRVTCWARTTVRPRKGSQNCVGGILRLQWQTAHGAWTGKEVIPDVELPPKTAEWTRLVRVVTVPADCGVGRLVVTLNARNQAPGEKTWFDDLCIEKIGGG
ncbi:MAG: DUF4838 domain-containing protein [Kiritimatiellae bacterium]|nr:DUF4838 domain-containing protein [Kiritimatiellia bacterium]